MLFFISACPTAVFADDTLPTVQFPIGLYSANIPNMKRVSELGFTFVVGGDDTMYIRSARDNGLDVVANTFYRGDTASRQKISRIRNEPNLIANVVVDEPDIYNKPPELVKRLSEEVKVLDPDHPLYITTWIPANYSKYKKYADIFSVTPYPINSTDTFQDLSLVYKSIY
ncbi:MAG: hypothetical protein JKX97_00900, partial [Candidatus Lindowbacteria bacterium]|nr:hypothetical protein [Candidatus Lindowbacteria bacterium]